MSVYEHILHERDLHGMCPVPPSRCVDESQDSGDGTTQPKHPHGTTRQDARSKQHKMSPIVCDHDDEEHSHLCSDKHL